MLSHNEKHILQLLDKLGGSNLSVQDQKKQVSGILEQIQRLEDEFNEKEVLGLPASKTFVILARRRLVEAQQMSLNNFNLLRESKVSKIREVPSSESSVSDEEKLFGNKPHSGDLQQTLYEAKTESLTQILNRMHGLAQEEIIKGELNISELDTSSKTLTELQSKYSAVDLLLNGSKRLVKILDEADKWDRTCMLASLGFLAFAFLYVLYRRVLHGPVKLLLWVILRFIGLSKLFSGTANKQLTSPMSVSSAPSESIILSSSTTSDPTTDPTTTAWTDNTGSIGIGDNGAIGDDIVREYSIKTQNPDNHEEQRSNNEDTNNELSDSETRRSETRRSGGNHFEEDPVHAEL